jgi:Iodothyronine deiodinase
VVYIQEAHPTDGWALPMNTEANIEVAQPTSIAERGRVADACMLRLSLTLPALLDDLENSTDQAYSALPDRLYLIDPDGRVAFRSDPGPWGFKVEELEAATTRMLGDTAAST